MAARDFGTIGFSFSGNEFRARQLAGYARSLMGQQNEYMAFGKLPSHIGQKTLNDGSVIRLIQAGGQKRIHIHVPFKEVGEEQYGGFIGKYNIGGGADGTFDDGTYIVISQQTDGTWEAKDIETIKHFYPDGVNTKYGLYNWHGATRTLSWGEARQAATSTLTGAPLTRTLGMTRATTDYDFVYCQGLTVGEIPLGTILGAFIRGGKLAVIIWNGGTTIGIYTRDWDDEDLANNPGDSSDFVLQDTYTFSATGHPQFTWERPSIAKINYSGTRCVIAWQMVDSVGPLGANYIATAKTTDVSLGSGSSFTFNQIAQDSHTWGGYGDNTPDVTLRMTSDFPHPYDPELGISDLDLVSLFFNSDGTVIDYGTVEQKIGFAANTVIHTMTGATGTAMDETMLFADLRNYNYVIEDSEIQGSNPNWVYQYNMKFYVGGVAIREDDQTFNSGDHIPGDNETLIAHDAELNGGTYDLIPEYEGCGTFRNQMDRNGNFLCNVSQVWPSGSIKYRRDIAFLGSPEHGDQSTNLMQLLGYEVGVGTALRATTDTTSYITLLNLGVI